MKALERLQDERLPLVLPAVEPERVPEEPDLSLDGVGVPHETPALQVVQVPLAGQPDQLSGYGLP
jgi:hypothetical protein